MSERRWNWHLWAGFLLCLFGIVSYPFIFARFPVTRDIPWVNFLLLGIGVASLLVGLKRAFRQSQQYRGKIVGPILGTVSLAAVVLFSFVVLHATKQLPASSGAPRIGQRAPDFTLADANNNPVALASLLSTPLANSAAPPKGVLLVFYRGYW